MEVLLGVDVGTSSTKGVLVTPDGQVVATEQRQHDMFLPRPGWAEVDAEVTWWGEVAEVCRALISRAPGPVLGVGVSGVGPSLVLCDTNLRPLRPAILYGIDTRATAEIDLLTRRYGADAVLAKAGKHLSSQSLGPKLEWVHRHEPEVWRAARSWHSCHSYLTAKLTGAYALDHHTASQVDPLYRVQAFDWHPDWAPEISDPIPLPALAWPSEVIGTVQPTAAAVTGIPAGTPVVAGTMDVLAEAVSVGVRRPGDLMIMYGSTVFCAQVLADYRVDPRLWTTVGLSPGTHLLAGGTATAGTLTAWLGDLTGGVEFDTLSAEAATAPLGAEGLLVVPYLAGERTPVLDPHARGLVAGLTLRHTRGHLFRAAYEGIGYGTRHILDAFDASSAPATRVLAVGGGVRSALWTAIVSDITGRTQLIPRRTIGACYGDALLAAIGVDAVPADTDWTVIDHHVVPDPERQVRYAELYEMWSELYPSTRETMHSLGAWAARQG